jgi:fucose permease
MQRNFSPAVLALNALLGAGTALAPVFVIVFVGLGAWWLLPVLVGIVLLVLLLFSVRAPLQVAADRDRSAPGRATTASAGFLRGLPRRFWLYAAVVLLYGIVETLNGNWSTLYLTQQRSVPTQWASLALTAFWAMVTVGRVLAAVLSSRVPARWIYLGLPVLLVVAFLGIAPGRKRCSLVNHLRGSQPCRWRDDRACLPGDEETDYKSCRS